MTRKKSATPPALEVPAFCMGVPGPARQRLPALAGTWAARYRASGDFPEPDVVPVATGTLVFIDSTADLSKQDGVRIYLVAELLDAIQKDLGWKDSEAVRAAFEAAIRGTCWGALALAMTDRRPQTAQSMRAHIDALIPCWDLLEQLRYVDFDPAPVALPDLIQSRFQGLTATWSPQPTGDVRGDLTAALAALEAADAETRIDRAAQRLAELAATNSRIRAKDRLTDPAFLRGELADMEPEDRAPIEAGSTSEALTFLIGTDRMLGG